MSEEPTYEVTFTAVAPKGDAIGDLDGVPVYVSGVIPGERAMVRLRKTRGHWIPGTLDHVIDASPDRVQPRCPVFGTCTGCQLQHIAYPRQVALKRQMVTAQLQRFGKFEDPPVQEVIPADNPWGYRNHGRFTVIDGRLGFVRRFRKQFVPIDACPIMDDRINEVVAEFNGHLEGATQCNVRVGTDPEPMMIQPKLDVARTTGQKSLTMPLLHHTFQVSAPSFFQVNRAQAEKLAEVVVKRIDVGPEGTVVDAYAGVGTFAVLLASSVGKVIAIEESGPAVRDAEVNAKGYDNVVLKLGKTEVVLPTIDEEIAAIVLDPPRSGCHKGTLDAVIARKPKRIVYVSCDGASLGRDLRILVDAGFHLE
ncbi:MAG: class I SAM-dependent RNA methyltransferase, partial [Nannocystaceae bacterium]|nr:class I SAM-dependent RNA methyltransferase [Nannocystaceae bacterium]